jgi:hypothetical protein
LIIFQLSEENGHKAIMGIVVRCTLLHERVCLIQEKHGIEVFGDLEYCFKLLLKRIGISVVDNKFACRYLPKSAELDGSYRIEGELEGELEILRGCLNRESLSDSRWATSTS